MVELQLGLDAPMGKKKYHFNKAQIAEMEKGYNPLIVLEYLRKVQPDILRTHTGEKPFACKHLDCTYLKS